MMDDQTDKGKLESKQAMRELTNRLSEIGRGYMLSQILFVANSANVFASLEEPRSAQEIAEQMNWSARGTRMLLDGLVALELIEQKNGRYQNAEIASLCLVPGKSAYQGDILKHHQNLWGPWSQLGEAVRTGTSVRGERREQSPEELRAFICGMSNIARFSASEILEAVDLSPYRNLLDLGGGPGTYSITFLKQHPEMRATIFDQAKVIEIAKEEVREAGLADRFDYIVGDIYPDDFGSGYDLLLISNIIHMMGPEEIQECFQKCAKALDSGGLLIVKDFLVDDDRAGPPFSLIFALNMLVNTEAGGTYTVGEADEWTKKAGFVNGRLVEITPQSRLWLAEKPK